MTLSKTKRSDSLTQSVIHTSTQKTHMYQHPVIYDIQRILGHTDVQEKKGKTY